MCEIAGGGEGVALLALYVESRGSVGLITQPPKIEILSDNQEK